MASNTTDIRTHVMGDMLMLTGTFTDGGTDVGFGDTLSTVFAAGGHVTSLYNTGVVKDGAVAAGDGSSNTTFTVKTVDMRLHFNVGESVYLADGTRLGKIATMAANATGMALDSDSLACVADAALYKMGPDQSAVTLNDGTLAVSIDETNSRVVFGNGNLGAASTAHTQDGRWWTLGQR